VNEETLVLRQELAALASEPDWDFLVRHDLLSNNPPRSLKKWAWRLTSRLLSGIGLMQPHLTKYQWHPTLVHGRSEEDGRALLIWATGVGRDELRRSCEGFSVRLNGNKSLVPVLVTDLADFGYFSRLGWLVEYLPDLSGEGHSYRDRKRRYLAWRYRDAVVMHLSAGLVSKGDWNTLVEDNRE